MSSESNQGFIWFIVIGVLCIIFPPLLGIILGGGILIGSLCLLISAFTEDDKKINPELQSEVVDKKIDENQGKIPCENCSTMIWPSVGRNRNGLCRNCWTKQLKQNNNNGITINEEMDLRSKLRSKSKNEMSKRICVRCSEFLITKKRLENMPKANVCEACFEDFQNNRQPPSNTTNKLFSASTTARPNKSYEYHNHCWNCRNHVNNNDCERCSTCRWYICNHCHSCSCNRTY